MADILTWQQGALNAFYIPDRLPCLFKDSVSTGVARSSAAAACDISLIQNLA